MNFRTRNPGVTGVFWALFFTVTGVLGDEIALPVDPRGVIKQSLFTDSVNACGPTSILNSLKFGDEIRRKPIVGCSGKTMPPSCNSWWIAFSKTGNRES